MPLIIITGHPSCGKTLWSNKLKKFLEDKNKHVLIVNEGDVIKKAGFEKSSVYSESRKEKIVRESIKSTVIQLISPQNVVIVDGLNYIKGFRYELYCAMKANHSTQCTIRIAMENELSWTWNEARTAHDEKYTRDVFNELIMRYEEPEDRCRWDSPLFYAYPDHNFDYSAVYRGLFEVKAPPPNMSTQNAFVIYEFKYASDEIKIFANGNYYASTSITKTSTHLKLGRQIGYIGEVPLSSTNFLHDLNRIIKDITNKIINQISTHCTEPFSLPGYDNLSIDLDNVTVAKITSLSRQYLIYAKMNVPDIRDVPKLYLQFLSTYFNKEIV